MPRFVAISGPSLSGKSTTMKMLKHIVDSENLAGRVKVVEDFQDKVFKNLKDRKIFYSYEEIMESDEYIYMYAVQWAKCLTETLNEYENSEYYDIVFIESCTIDILIYAIINLWFHYPLTDLLTELVNNLLALRDRVDKIYMMTPHDDEFEDTEKNYRCKKSHFNRTRSMEIGLYKQFSDSVKVEVLGLTIEGSPAYDIAEKEFSIYE